METLEPKVTLISCTPNPLETLAWVCKIYTQVGLDSVEKIKEHGLVDEASIREFLKPFIAEPHQAFMEYIQCIFIIENVSRAFQQQLTRHRMASFAIQSLRVYDVGNFADEGKYTVPSTMKDKEAFHREMVNQQNAYRAAIELGESTEDARGMLPLNIHSTITMRVDFNALRHILQGRLCLTAQEEARKVGYLFKEAVLKGMGSFFADLLQPPCHAIYGGKCTRAHYYCGIPLYLASTDAQAWSRWLATTGGAPEGSKVITNSVALPQDVAGRILNVTPMTQEELVMARPEGAR